MNAKKKIPSIVEQVKSAGESFAKWGRGEKRLRTTIATRDGKRSVAYTTRLELEAKLKDAEVFKGYRAELGLSQPQFARLIHSTPAAIKQWETGRRAIPSTVRALAELALNIPEARRHLEATAESSATSASASTRKRA
jgi:DNA-binding transcriptional regulator YiaG